MLPPHSFLEKILGIPLSFGPLLGKAILAGRVQCRGSMAIGSADSQVPQAVLGSGHAQGNGINVLALHYTFLVYAYREYL